MADRTCGDCLYYGRTYKWKDDDYCNKNKCKVEYDQRACGNYLDDSHDCCYDCDAGKDMGITFFCKENRTTIETPGSYYCYRFRD